MSSVLEIGTNITLLESEMNNNFTSVQTNILSINSTLNAQTIQILNAIAEIQGIYRVHYDLVDQLGIGLSWNTFFVYVNNTRQYKQDAIYSNATDLLLIIEVRDGFNTSLTTKNYTISSHKDIILSVDLYWVIFRNTGNFTSYVYITRNNIQATITISPNTDKALRMTSGDYEVAVYYYEDEWQNSSTVNHLGDLADYGKKLFKLSKFRVSAKLPSVVDISAPTFSELVPEQSVWQQLINAFMAGVTITAFGAALASVVVYLSIKEGWFGFKAVVLKRAPEDSLIKPDWMENKEDKLDRNMQQNPKKYTKKKGNKFLF